MTGRRGRKSEEWSRRDFLICAGAGLAWGALEGIGRGETEEPGRRRKLSGRLVLQLGLCSAAVYGRGRVEDHPEWGETKVELVGEPFNSDKQDLRGFVGRTGEAVVVAFRGTVITEMKNWKTNIERSPVTLCEGKSCRVHQGFRDAYARLSDSVQRLIEKAGGAKQFIFTGHSLGGALALLAAEEFQRKLLKQDPDRKAFDELMVCTFGQPRVGDRPLEEEFQGKLYRFVNDFDPVPHVPVTRNYGHFDDAIWFDRHQKITTKSAMGIRLAIEGAGLLKELRKINPEESLSDLAGREAKAGGKKLVEAIKNHRLDGPTGYLACLRKYASGTY